MRVFDRAQARIVGGFTSDSRTNRRLTKLTHAGFLKRFYLGRNGVGAPAFYTLTRLGAWTAEVESRSPRRMRDEVLFADAFTQHQLVINAVYLKLKYQPLPEGLMFKRWIVFREPIAHAVPLIPDGYAEVQTPQELEALFLEVDLGNEHLHIWRKKAKQYLNFALYGQFNQLFHLRRFRVLVVVNSLRRIMWLRKAVAKVTSKIFFFATIDEINRDGVFGTRWLRPTSEERQALLS